MKQSNEFAWQGGEDTRERGVCFLQGEKLISQNLTILPF